MVSTYSPTKNLELVGRGDQVGTWDTPENSNWSIVDSVTGGAVAITLNNTPVVLSAAQFQQSQITFQSTLQADVAITFPTSFTGHYIIQNLCTGSSQYSVTLQTTASGGEIIACQPGLSFDAINDGTNLKFHNLPHVGSYWDYAGSSVPAWVSNCTKPPWLNCDGSTFESSTYPALSIILGSSILPDSRGRARVALDQGSGTLGSSSVTGISANSVLATGGTGIVTLTSNQMPTHTHTWATYPQVSYNTGSYTTPGAVAIAALSQGGVYGTNVNAINGTLNSAGGSSAHSNVQPSLIHGLTFIRAA